MGKLYDELKYQMQYAKSLKNKKDFKSIINRNIAESKINKLDSLIKEYYKQKAPNLNFKGIHYDDIAAFEDDLDNVENLLSDEIDNILEDYEELKAPDVSFIDNEYKTRYDQFALLDNIVKQTVEIHYNNLNPNDDNPHQATKELILALQKETYDLMNSNKVKDNIKKTDAEFYLIRDFLNKPATSFVNGYKRIFKFQNDNEKATFINEVDKEARYLNINPLAIKAENKFLKMIKGKGITAHEDLAINTLKAIKKYQKDSKEFLQKHPGDVNKVVPFAKLLYDIKDKLAKVVIENDIELSADYHSEFIKRYLANPIDCMKFYYENQINKLEEKELLQDGLFIDEDPNLNYDELKENLEEKVAKYERERAIYNIYATGKKDSWSEYQDYKAAWFMNHFNTVQEGLTINQTIEGNKGGVFENLFNTTSKEWKEFSKALIDITKDGPFKGDLDGLDKLAKNYIAHKLKYYNPYMNGYDENEVNKLDSTGRGRVNACLAVIEAIKNAKLDISEGLDPKEYVAKNLDEFEAHDEYWTDKNGWQKDLDTFQNALKNDSELNEDIPDKLNEATLEIDPKDLEDLDTNEINKE